MEHTNDGKSRIQVSEADRRTLRELWTKSLAIQADMRTVLEKYLGPNAAIASLQPEGNDGFVVRLRTTNPNDLQMRPEDCYHEPPGECGPCGPDGPVGPGGGD